MRLTRKRTADNNKEPALIISGKSNARTCEGCRRGFGTWEMESELKLKLEQGYMVQGQRVGAGEIRRKGSQV